MADSKMVKHMACPKCNSSDANALYEDDIHIVSVVKLDLEQT